MGRPVRGVPVQGLAERQLRADSSSAAQRPAGLRPRRACAPRNWGQGSEWVSEGLQVAHAASGRGAPPRRAAGQARDQRGQGAQVTRRAGRSARGRRGRRVARQARSGPRAATCPSSPGGGGSNRLRRDRVRRSNTRPDIRAGRRVGRAQPALVARPVSAVSAEPDWPTDGLPVERAQESARTKRAWWLRWLPAERLRWRP